MSEETWREFDESLRRLEQEHRTAEVRQERRTCVGPDSHRTNYRTTDDDGLWPGSQGLQRELSSLEDLRGNFLYFSRSKYGRSTSRVYSSDSSEANMRRERSLLGTSPCSENTDRAEIGVPGANQ